MHLTNYSVNKHSKSFDKDERTDKGSKRCVYVCVCVCVCLCLCTSNMFVCYSTSVVNRLGNIGQGYL